MKKILKILKYLGKGIKVQIIKLIWYFWPSQGMRGERSYRTPVVESCRVQGSLGCFACTVLKLFKHCTKQILFLSLNTSVKLGTVAAGYWAPKKLMLSDWSAKPMMNCVLGGKLTTNSGQRTSPWQHGTWFHWADVSIGMAGRNPTEKIRTDHKKSIEGNKRNSRENQERAP